MWNDRWCSMRNPHPLGTAGSAIASGGVRAAERASVRAAEGASVRASTNAIASGGVTPVAGPGVRALEGNGVRRGVSGASAGTANAAAPRTVVQMPAVTPAQVAAGAPPPGWRATQVGQPRVARPVREMPAVTAEAAAAGAPPPGWAARPVGSSAAAAGAHPVGSAPGATAAPARGAGGVRPRRATLPGAGPPPPASGSGTLPGIGPHVSPLGGAATLPMPAVGAGYPVRPAIPRTPTQAGVGSGQLGTAPTAAMPAVAPSAGGPRLPRHSPAHVAIETPPGVVTGQPTAGAQASPPRGRRTALTDIASPVSAGEHAHPTAVDVTPPGHHPTVVGPPALPSQRQTLAGVGPQARTPSARAPSMEHYNWQWEDAGNRGRPPPGGFDVVRNGEVVGRVLPPGRAEVAAGQANDAERAIRSGREPFNLSGEAGTAIAQLDPGLPREHALLTGLIDDLDVRPTPQRDAANAVLAEHVRRPASGVAPSAAPGIPRPP